MSNIAEKKIHTPASRAVAMAEAGIFPNSPGKSDKTLWSLRVTVDLALATRNATTAALSAIQNALENAVKDRYATMTIVCLRATVARAEEANTLAQATLDKARRDVRARFSELKVPCPIQFHENDCPCNACSPFGEEHA